MMILLVCLVGILIYGLIQLVPVFPHLDIRVIPTGNILVNLGQKLNEISIDNYHGFYDL